ncbi:MAG: DUF1501 domain-containing protein [Pseudobdellovibrio sp.]
MKRRDFLKQAGLLGVLPYLNWSETFLSHSALAETLKKAKAANKTLIVVFQRGAVDGLSMLSPIGDKNYNTDIRPSLYINPQQMLKLDSYFALHPSLGGLKNLWDKGMLTALHQVGSPSTSRSHFDSQDYFEMGTPDVKNTENGFLTRAVNEMKNTGDLKLTSLSVQTNLARMISGDRKSLAFNDLNRFSIKGFGPVPSNNTGTSPGNGFESFFETALDEVMKGQNKNSISLLQEFGEAQKVKIENEFPKGGFSNHLKDIARVIKSGLYIPFIVTEVGGWDSHRDQGNEKGQLANRLKEFGDSINAFVEALGPKMQDVTLVTVTEFGRTVKENGSKGTDHGHGSCYFVVGQNLKPKSIHADWKELKNENLYEGRDLPVNTDFREVFADVLETNFAIKDFSKIFPGYTAKKKLKMFKT